MPELAVVVVFDDDRTCALRPVEQLAAAGKRQRTAEGVLVARSDEHRVEQADRELRGDEALGVDRKRDDLCPVAGGHPAQ